MSQEEKPKEEAPKDASKESSISHFKEHSVAEFFKKNRQMLGLYGKLRSLTTIVHEFVTNSIDACEEAGILPDIEVKLVKLEEESYELTVTDNGPGMQEKILGKALGKMLAGTKFHRQIQARGQQGLGASGAILFSQITTGQPTKIVSGTGKEKPLYVELKINTEKNEPLILEKKTFDKEFKGLAIKCLFKEVNYTDNAQNAFEYLKRTSIANPHVQIKFYDPSEKLYVFERSISEIPKRPIEIKPHIKSVNTDEFLSYAKNSDHRSISAYIKDTYDRVGDKFLEDLQKNLDFKLETVTVKKMEWNTAEKIVKAIQKTKTISPRTDALIPIEEESLKKSITKILKPETLSVLTRKPTTYKGGFPFQVEVAISFGGDSGYKLKDGTMKMDIMRFANRAPLLFDGGGCAITNAINSIDWKRYNIRDIENSPITVLVNISSVHIPYTSAGKQAIAEEEEIIDEIKLALMTAARYISTHISRKQALSMKQEKKKMFLRYAHEIAYSLGVLTKQKSAEIFQKLEKIIEEKLAIEELEEKLNKDKLPEVEKTETENNNDEETNKEKKSETKKAQKKLTEFEEE